MLALTLPEKRIFLQHKLKEQKDIKEMEVGGGGTQHAWNYPLF